ncbi:hypothetical protein QQF64_013758 [Cirrhinus molitorella]|uniref:Ig-like domain-containing protein n=1 Tax=Cirrhinus molitorella TaxID=172907 RepID=A0ABR3LS17_9TELE
MSIWLMMIWVSHTAGTATKPFIVTQWPTVAEVMAGEDIVLKCNIAELYSPCSTVAWLRVIPENATITLTNRLQIDSHHSSNQWTSICTGVIANATVHDSSMYYCAAVQSRFAHIGNGSRVIVKERTVFPVIDILTPLITNGPWVPIQCVVNGVEASRVHMFWTVEGRKKKGQPVLTHGNDGDIQIARNQILITAEEWERMVQCVCVVGFGGHLYTKTLQPLDAPDVCYAVKYIYLSVCLIFGLLLLITVRSGEKVTMYCKLNEVQSFCHTVAWVRVHPVSRIIDILQDSNIPHQTKDQEESMVCHASIYNAMVQDSGTYYCIATDREHMYLGNGTAVTVQADNTVMPSVDIMAFASSNNHDSTVTLQCTIEGFAPSHVYVHWLIGSRKKTGQTLFVWEEGDEKSVKTHNYITVSAEEWRTGGTCTCVVNLGGWMFNKTLLYYDIQDTCYPLVRVTRIFALVTSVLFFTVSLILGGRL